MLQFIFTLLGCKSQAPILTDTSYLTPSQSIHQFTMTSIEGKEVKLSDYKGKVLLIVNVASKCGLTPQYEDLEKLYYSKKDKGLVILGFPANNFLSQEPGTDAEIKEFCTKNYGVSFPMFSKISVKGKNQHELYQFLTQKNKNGVIDSEVSWNFQKYLLDKNGYLVTYFSPNTKVTEANVLSAIDNLMR